MISLPFLLKTAFDLLTLLFVLRFTLHAVRAEFYNPLSQFVYKVTNGAVRPLRRLIPNVGGLETASLLLMVLIQGIGLLLLFSLFGMPISPGALILYAVLHAALVALRFLVFALIVNAILSWVPNMAGHPLARLLDQICGPLLRPIRSFLPLVAGIDLSPLVMIILLQAVSMELAGRVPLA